MHHLAKVACGFSVPRVRIPPSPPTPAPSRARVLLACISCCAVLAACATPTLHVTSTDAAGAIYVDGELRGHGDATLPLPYYGTVAVEAAPAPRDGAPLPRADRAQVRAAPPAPGWLFPLDLLAESWQRLTGELDVRTTLAPTTYPEEPLGTQPGAAGGRQALVDRARALRLQR